MVEKLRFPVIVGSLMAATGWGADIPGPSAIVTPPQPQWTELTTEQKTILAPLSDDWDAMEYYRQKKWLVLTRRFATMTPEEQRRIQVQMQDWGKLTPEERNLARENFKTTNKLPIEKKQELRQKWEEYSSLPEEEKERLKHQAIGKPVPRPGKVSSAAPPAGAATGSAAPVVAATGAASAEATPVRPPAANQNSALPVSETDAKR